MTLYVRFGLSCKMIEILVLFEVVLAGINRKWILKGVRLRKGERRIF
jgi:hypothetical protein